MSSNQLLSVSGAGARHAGTLSHPIVHYFRAGEILAWNFSPIDGFYIVLLTHCRNSQTNTCCHNAVPLPFKPGCL